MTYSRFDALFERFHYPAGESHLRLRADVTHVRELVVEVRATGFETIGEILTADRLLRRNHVDATWFVPYFPFARHDRRIDRHDGFELELALGMVEPLEIVIADPHSDVAGMLPHIPQSDAVAEFRSEGLLDDDPLIVIPDAGATKKAYEWTADADVLQASKRRSPHTGELSGFDIGSDDLAGRTCVVVDDICDGGGTFLGLAKELRNANAGPLRLAVTHGLFTKGTAALAAQFDQILTFTFATDAPPEGVVGIPFKRLYERGTVQ